MTQAPNRILNVLTSLTLLCGCASVGGESATGESIEEEFADTSTESVDEQALAYVAPGDQTLRRFRRGDIDIRTVGCSRDQSTQSEVGRILDAYEVLYHLRWGGRAAFENCVWSAPLVETGFYASGLYLQTESCGIQLDRTPLVEALMELPRLTIHCEDLISQPGISTNAEAEVAIRGNELTINRKFLAGSASDARVAAVIAHEIMHNRGFRHETHPLGYELYPLTIPEQIEACVERGIPNAAPAGFVDAVGPCANPLDVPYYTVFCVGLECMGASIPPIPGGI